MARPKQIEDAVLLDLIKEYFDKECGKNGKRIKTSEVVRYINNHGYPDYQVTTLRRTPAAMGFIKQLEELKNNDEYMVSATYQTIDASLFVDTHRSREALIKAITDRDTYYKTVADSAVLAIKTHNKLAADYNNEVAVREAFEARVQELETQLKESADRCKALEKTLKAYEDVIDTYVYPEIANTLLAKEGIIRRKEGSPIDSAALSSNLITSQTKVEKSSKSGSKVIEGLFKDFK